MSLSSVFEVNTNRQTPIMTLLNILCWWVSFLAARDGSWLLFVGFLVLAIWGLLFLLYTAPTVIKLNPQGIELDYIFGQYQINWDEVENIEHAWGHLIIEGHGKLLTLPGPGDWTANKREEAKMQIQTLSGSTIK